eukprot:6208820-Pyramimonas_sp.AAC.1
MLRKSNKCTRHACCKRHAPQGDCRVESSTSYEALWGGRNSNTCTPHVVNDMLLKETADESVLRALTLAVCYLVLSTASQSPQIHCPERPSTSTAKSNAPTGSGPGIPGAHRRIPHHECFRHVRFHHSFQSRQKKITLPLLQAGGRGTSCKHHDEQLGPGASRPCRRVSTTEYGRQRVYIVQYQEVLVQASSCLGPSRIHAYQVQLKRATAHPSSAAQRLISEL